MLRSWQKGQLSDPGLLAANPIAGASGVGKDEAVVCPPAAMGGHTLVDCHTHFVLPFF